VFTVIGESMQSRARRCPRSYIIITDPGELLVLLAFRHRPGAMLEVLDEMEARFGPCPLRDEKRRLVMERIN